MISAIILTKDEEANLDRCLESLKGLREIIVFDDESTDKTTSIAKKYGAKVIVRALHKDFAAQRNAAMKQATHNWVLFIDADEVLSPALHKELLALQADIKESPDSVRTPRTDETAAYRIRRADMWWGQKLTHGEVYSAAHTGIIRLVNRNAGKWVGVVHEEFQTDSQIGALKAELIHYPHQTVTSFLNHVNDYSTMRATELEKQGKRVNIIELIIIPFFKFLYTYIMKAGYREGAAGFTYSFMMSFHSFLVRSKMYVAQYQQQNKKIE